MSYWHRTTKEQLQEIFARCKGKTILDIGAWNADLASLLVENGAAHVTTLDKEDPVLEENRYPTKISKVIATFAEFQENYDHKVWDVGILSWPANNDYASKPIVSILKQCAFIIYIGCNQGGTQCGTPLLWKHLSTLQVLKYLPTPNNTVIVYGNQFRDKPDLLEEEELGLLLKVK